MPKLREALPIGYSGVSAAQLAETCQELGVEVHPVRTNLHELATYAAPSILHVNRDHFIALLGRDGARLVVFDNTIGVFDCSETWFRGQYVWEGDTLVVGAVPSRYVSILRAKT